MPRVGIKRIPDDENHWILQQRTQKEQGKLGVPTLIAWDNGDIFFDVKWLHWLEEATPGTLSWIKLANARPLFPSECSGELNDALQALRQTLPDATTRRRVVGHALAPEVVETERWLRTGNKLATNHYTIFCCQIVATFGCASIRCRTVLNAVLRETKFRAGKNLVFKTVMIDDYLAITG